MTEDIIDQQKLCGYVYNEKTLQAFVDSGMGQHLSYAAVEDIGKGKELFLWEIEKQLTGKLRSQERQEIGDCVSWGFCGAANALQFVLMMQDPTLEFKPLCTEYTYGTARVQIGQGGCGFGDGAQVSWALEGAQKLGFLARGKYGDIDVTTYSGERARAWGRPRAGAPTALLAVGKLNLVLQCHLITGNNKYEQARDVIASLGAIVTGSNQLFSSHRDAQGFCQRAGGGGHCTCYRGFSDNPKRPGIVYNQSWGPGTPSGGAVDLTLPSGKEITLPEGNFFIDPEDFDRMHREGSGNEVWAITSEIGFVAPEDQQQFVFYSHQGELNGFLHQA